MIELHGNDLRFRFPDVHPRASCRISFLRTLRIPDDNRSYPLPPGLSRFPLNHVDDYAERVPEDWGRHGGVFLPMHQAEAMWINFESTYPMAVKIAAGKSNAVTGEGWRNALSDEPSQDYLVIPDQPWLDGFYAGEGLIRQFVAMPLGEGFTAEEQLTGAAEHGGVQIVVYPMKASAYERLRSRRTHMAHDIEPAMPVMACAVPSMGLAPGGLIGTGHLRGRARPRGVGHVHEIEVLRASPEQPAVPACHRCRAAYQTSIRSRLHRSRASLVRVLRRRPEGPGGCRQALGPRQRRGEEGQAGQGRLGRKRTAESHEREDGERRREHRARRRLLNPPIREGQSPQTDPGTGISPCVTLKHGPSIPDSSSIDGRDKEDSGFLSS